MRNSVTKVADLDGAVRGLKEINADGISHYIFKDLYFDTSIGTMRIRKYEGDKIIESPVVVQHMTDDREVLFWKGCESVQEAYRYMDKIFSRTGNSCPRYKESVQAEGEGVECRINGRLAYFEAEGRYSLKKRRAPMARLDVASVVDNIISTKEMGITETSKV